MITFSKVKAADLSSLLTHYESGDYYAEDQKVVAVVHGNLCLALGLNEGQKLTATQVKNILEGLRPDTAPGRKVRFVGDYLTKRLRIDRMAAIDFTISAPKDMSLLRALTGDERILDLHRSANKAAMEQAQRLICCGRRDRGNHQRSGEGFWIEYRHDVSRALDPDTHSHNLLVNIARDSGGRLVAAEIQELTAAEHIAAMRRIYWSHMAAGMRSLGYDIEMREVGGEVKVDHNGRPSVIKGGWTLKNGGTCSPAMAESFFQLKLNSKIGVWPLGLHVRTRCGFWLRPLSSMKIVSGSFTYWEMHQHLCRRFGETCSAHELHLPRTCFFLKDNANLPTRGLEQALEDR